MENTKTNKGGSAGFNCRIKTMEYNEKLDKLLESTKSKMTLVKY